MTYSFPYLELVCCSMSISNCCFLTCIQISQQAGQVVWYSHLFKNFPQFVVIHTVKGFGIVNKEVYVFLEPSCFFDDPMDVGNLISGSAAFLNPAWTSGSSQFTYCWSLAWRILSITLLALFTTAKGWRHSSTHEWTKCVYTYNRELFSLKKGGNTDTCYNNGWTMKTQCWVKEIRQKRPHIMILLIWRTQNSQFCRNRK